MPDDTWPAAHANQILLDAARRFFGDIERAEPVGSAPHLLRVTAAAAEYVVREWRAGTTRDKIDLAARALVMAADGRLPRPQPVPAGSGSWAVQVGDRLLSAATWLPGRSLARYGDFRTPDGNVIDVPLPASAPAESIILEAVRAIGRFHAETAPIVRESAGGEATLSRLLRHSERTWSGQRKVVGQRAANSPEIRRWLRCGNRIFPVASALLEQFGAAAVPSTVVHGDIWPANLLIEGNAASRTLTGIVGWSSVAIGSPLVDLAHLAIHSSGWSGALAENILGEYTAVADLSPGERRLLPVVAAVDLVPRVGWLLDLAFVDDRMIGHESQPILRSGLKSLLMSLENLTNVLAPDAEWDQRKTMENRRQRGDSAAPRRIRPTGTKAGRRSGSTRSPPASRPGRPKRD